MIFMIGALLEGLAELLWPARCVGCDELGVLLCERCDDELPRIAPEHACPRCGAPFGSIVCTECYGAFGPVPLCFSQAVSAFEFCDAAARLTVIYKDQHEHRLATLCALAIAEVMPADWLKWADAITWVPADWRALRRRGFCHMQLVAEQLAAITGIAAVRLLDKQAVRDQRKLNRRQRAENLAQAFSFIGAGTPAPTKTPGKIASALFAGWAAKPAAGAVAGTDEVIADSIVGAHIILLDDVSTTMATLNAASAVLLAAGAAEVRAATVCRVY
jgi:predicted amidophosphoribosyltransferase